MPVPLHPRISLEGVPFHLPHRSPQNSPPYLPADPAEPEWIRQPRLNMQKELNSHRRWQHPFRLRFRIFQRAKQHKKLVRVRRWAKRAVRGVMQGWRGCRNPAPSLSSRTSSPSSPSRTVSCPYSPAPSQPFSSISSVPDPDPLPAATEAAVRLGRHTGLWHGLGNGGDMAFWVEEGGEVEWWVAGWVGGFDVGGRFEGVEEGGDVSPRTVVGEGDGMGWGGLEGEEEWWWY